MRFRIVSRLLAAAFNLAESYEELFTIECVDCPKGPHEVMNAMETKQERAEWMLAHMAETEHRHFEEYDITRRSVHARPLGMKD